MIINHQLKQETEVNEKRKQIIENNSIKNKAMQEQKAKIIEKKQKKNSQMNADLKQALSNKQREIGSLYIFIRVEEQESKLKLSKVNELKEQKTKAVQKRSKKKDSISAMVQNNYYSRYIKNENSVKENEAKMLNYGKISR